MFEWLVNPNSLHWILQGLSLTVEITLFGVFLGLVLRNTAGNWRHLWRKSCKRSHRSLRGILQGKPTVCSTIYSRLHCACYTQPPDRPLSFGFLGFRIKQCWLPERLHERRQCKPYLMTKWQAGLSVGMSKIQTLRHVILPQAYRIVIPSWTNEFCSLNKKHSYISIRGLI